MTEITRNAFFSSITLGLRFVSTAIVYVILARALGVEEFGRFAFALAFTGILVTLVDYGFNLYTVVRVSALPESALNIVNEMVAMKTVIFIFISIILPILLSILRFPLETRTIIYILWVAGGFYSYGAYLNVVFRSFNQFEYETYPTIILNILQFILIIIMVTVSPTIISISSSFLISRVFYFAISLYLFQVRIGKINLIKGIRTSHRKLLDVLPFGIHALLGTLYLQIDSVLLSLLKGDADVAYYQSAMRIVMACMIIYDIVISSYLPIMASEFRINLEQFKQNGLAVTKYMLLIGGILSSGLLIYTERIMTLLYGQEYSGAVSVLQLLSIVIFIRFVGASYAMFITLADMQHIRVLGGVISVVLNIILNVILIPRFGAIGAAIASVFTHIVLHVIYVIYGIRVAKQSFIDIHWYRGIVLLIFSFAVCNSLNKVVPIVSVVVYFSLIIVTYYVATTAEERRRLRHLFSTINLLPWQVVAKR